MNSVPQGTPEQTSLSLGFSPCPNDTFIFHALVHGMVGVDGIAFEPVLEDVEALNRKAISGELEVSKVSYGAIPYLLDEYVLLRSGGALGRGCGPLLVARTELPLDALRRGRIAIPGRLTTANLLLRLFDAELPQGEETLYSDIMPHVADGSVDAGLIIHESRFTFQDHGLVCLADLGAWWERATGSAIPLGGIVAKRSLGDERIRAIEAAVSASVRYAFDHPAASGDFVRRHAQEMDEEVMRGHIDLYVNDFSIALGREGEDAVVELLSRAVAAGLTPATVHPFPA